MEAELLRPNEIPAVGTLDLVIDCLTAPPDSVPGSINTFGYQLTSPDDPIFPDEPERNGQSVELAGNITAETDDGRYLAEVILDGELPPGPAEIWVSCLPRSDLFASVTVTIAE